MVSEKKEKIRLDFLDGIRGWAAAIVVFGHTMGGVIAINAPNFANHQWLSFFTNAHLSVLVFFVLSGYVLSISQIFSSKPNLAISTLARYFRLAIPIFTISIIAYILMKLDLFYNVSAASTDISKSWLGRFFTFEPDFFNVIKYSFYSVFFSYDDHTTYNSSLWTMPIEMMGSLFIYAYLAIFRREKFIPLVSIALLVYFFFNNSFLLCFMAGYVLAELKKKKDYKVTGFKDAVMFLSFLSIVYLDTYYRPGTESHQALEAILIVCIISYSSILSKAFSSNISKFMGRISFSLYLVQIVVICSLSSYLKIFLEDANVNIYTSAFINLIITLAACILFARILAPVDEWSVQISKKIAMCILDTISKDSEKILVKKPL
ncbi:acyltransferase family protein [Duffyella gerundensis]|uniref:acyltransferase family protein n=1 Tax=Duffyella gerundensis TaxID=1619313 RepID=UPI001654884C|nr:acyltransferase [Duffyella gerundensis]